MINQISQQIKEVISNFSEEDNIILNNKIIKINKDNFFPINQSKGKSIAFIDGGQAEILSSGNFCLSFIRVYSIVFKNNVKVMEYKKEFYLFTKAVWRDSDLFYESKIFGDKIINENDLLISSKDSSIRTGVERAPISKVTNMARRFAELSLSSFIETDFIVLDGTLESTYHNEKIYLSKLKGNVNALAKSSSLFTTSGNSPLILLNNIGINGCWNYIVDEKTSFVKLNEKSKHIFRFEGNKEILSFLIFNCQDALFLGYPYGLILADRLARVSNSEKNNLVMKFLLNSENKEIVAYLHSSNAHEILDNIS